MKKSNFINSIWTVILCLFFVACEGTFVPDPIDPRLPKYTEAGNSVAGALVNNEIWKSQVGYFIYAYDEPHITIFSKEDSISIKFRGETNGKNASIKFDLKGLGISKFEDLLRLKGQKITLDGSKNIGYYIINNNNNTTEKIYKETTYTNKGIGQIYFKHILIQNDAVILSGTFGFSVTNEKGQNITISFGRFDYSIQKSNISVAENTELTD